MTTSQTPSTPRFEERLNVPWWAWLLAILAAVSMGLAYLAPFTPGVGAVVGLVTFIAIAAGLMSWTPRLVVTDDELQAGPARIPLHVLKAPQALDPDAARRLRGPDADPRAWMLLRGWVATAVRVQVDDPSDPTPYLYLSTRRPDELVQALRARP